MDGWQGIAGQRAQIGLPAQRPPCSAARCAGPSAIAFWLGSSRSSQIKDKQITALPPAATRR